MNVNSRLNEIRVIPHQDREAIDLFLEVRLWMHGTAKREDSGAMLALRELLRRADITASLQLAILEEDDPERTLLEILCPEESEVIKGVRGYIEDKQMRRNP